VDGWHRQLHRAACRTKEDNDLPDLIQNGIWADFVSWTDSLGQVTGLRQLGFSQVSSHLFFSASILFYYFLFSILDSNLDSNLFCRFLDSRIIIKFN
jgi:hypothetical protein